MIKISADAGGRVEYAVDARESNRKAFPLMRKTIAALAGLMTMSGLSQAAEAQVSARVPLGTLATPADIAGAAVFLASPESRYITGVVLPVDGGYTAS